VVDSVVYEIELVYSTNAEGVVGEYQTIYRFMKEGGKWRFDGSDSDRTRNGERCFFVVKQTQDRCTRP
jgi:hypothetical protein